MLNFVIRVASNALALWLAAEIVTGVHLGDPGRDWQGQVLIIAVIALIFGVVNAIIKPIASVLAFPAVVLTLGLFTFVVNAAMLEITAWLSDIFGLPFSIDHFFWDAVFAAVIITLVSWALNTVLPEERRA